MTGNEFPLFQGVVKLGLENKVYDEAPDGVTVIDAGDPLNANWHIDGELTAAVTVGLVITWTMSWASQPFKVLITLAV